MSLQHISTHTSVYRDGMNCVVIQKNGAACLINCHHQIEAKLLSEPNLNVRTIVCLNYRSSVNGGIAKLYSPGVQIAAPEGQTELFESPMERLGGAQYRFRVYDFHPDNDITNDPVEISVKLAPGMALDFEGIKLDFFEVKGDTAGELGCVIHDGIEIGVLADVVCGDGGQIKIPFLHRMCKDPGGVDDYHAFLAEKDVLLESLRPFEGCELLVCARGEPVDSPAQAICAFGENLERLYQNYSAASAMNFYYPGYLKPVSPMPPAKIVPTPPNVKYLFCNFLIISENRRGFLLDCGTRQGLDMLKPLFESGELEGIDICYITHFHNDHVDMLEELQSLYGCEIYAPKSFADMLINPEAYYITCLSDVKVKPVILPDNHKFTWQGYKFTHFEFPGQTLYHGGLVYDDGKTSILFSGDSFCPTGFDDYCPQNRNFTGRNRGFHKCLDIIERTKPTCIANQHQEKAFVYTKKEIDFLQKNLDEREGLLCAITPWQSPDYSLDRYFARFYPYVSRVKPNELCQKELQFTNHTGQSAQIKVKFTGSKGIVLPGDIEITLPPATSGFADQEPADVCVPAAFLAETPGTYAVGAEVWQNGAYFGEICKGVIFAE